MRLIELLIDKLTDTSLFEMAYERKHAWRVVNGISYPLTEHLVKILVIPNATYRNHWIQEVNRYLRKIDDISLKPKNRRLTQRQYWDWLVAEPDYRIEKIVNHIKYDYPDEQINIPVDLNETIQHILYRISVDLGNDNFDRIERYF